MSTQDASSPRTTRIIIVDDDPIVREVLTTALGSETDIEVIATAANGAEAVDVVHAHTVDVVLMDVQMPVLDGVAATSRILALGGGTRVLLLTTFDDDALREDGLAAGASGFLLKTTPPERIAEAIRTVRAGGKVLSPGPTSRVLERYVRGQSPRVASTEDLDLSEREQEVLRLLCRARTNHQIARRMNIADTTVKTHVSSIMRKMGVGNRLEIVVEAHRRGLGG
ncbi:response regulator [Actinomyces israelii]|uniref:response regulator n=1 Tax=Actinomyces israelii TaxID=1659 RepID=UPI00235598AE|nr:response regulator transcription factor [Actinomyces israelii]